MRVCCQEAQLERTRGGVEVVKVMMAIDGIGCLQAVESLMGTHHHQVRRKYVYDFLERFHLVLNG